MFYVPFYHKSLYSLHFGAFVLRGVFLRLSTAYRIPLRGSFSSNTRLASFPHCLHAQYLDYCSDSLHNYGILCMSMRIDLPTLQHTSFGPRFWQNVTWHYNSGGSLPVIRQRLPHANVFIFGMFARISGVPKLCVSPTHLLSFVYLAYSQSIAHFFHL